MNTEATTLAPQTRRMPGAADRPGRPDREFDLLPSGSRVR